MKMLTYMEDATIVKRAGALLLGPVVGLGYVMAVGSISYGEKGKFLTVQVR